MKFLFCREILIASVKGTTWKDVWHIARTVVVIGLLMNMFLGNSEQWEQMLAEEERLAAEALNNSTIAEEIVDVVATVLDDYKTDEF
jgi:hypothetical protein